MKFTDMGLDPALVDHLTSVHFVRCTPIQEKVIPRVLREESVMAQSQTGTGKTAAFLIPILNRFIAEKKARDKKNKTDVEPGNPKEGNRVKVLVISPTRELSMQIMEDMVQLGARRFGVGGVLLCGGGSYTQQEQRLKTAKIIVATPGRLLDFCKRRRGLCSEVSIFVVDEADRLFDMGFYPHLTEIVSLLPPKERRVDLLFSATMTEKVRQMAYMDLHQPEEVEITAPRITVDTTEQKLFHLLRDEKKTLLVGILKTLEKDQTAIVFVNTRKETEELAAQLAFHGVKCDYIQGDLPQSRRKSVIRNAKKGKVPVLVATDVAARGLHVENLDYVINYDLPEKPEDYVHRIGRTGRVGRGGNAITFACDQYVFSLEKIEKFLGYSIPVATRQERERFSSEAIREGHSRRETRKKGLEIIQEMRKKTGRRRDIVEMERKKRVSRRSKENVVSDQRIKTGIQKKPKKKIQTLNPMTREGKKVQKQKKSIISRMFTMFSKQGVSDEHNEIDDAKTKRKGNMRGTTQKRRNESGKRQSGRQRTSKASQTQRGSAKRKQGTFKKRDSHYRKKHNATKSGGRHRSPTRGAYS